MYRFYLRIGAGVCGHSVRSDDFLLPQPESADELPPGCPASWTI
jgi:hypothetical protein